MSITSARVNIRYKQPTAFQRFAKRMVRNKYLYLLMVIPILYFAIFKYAPMYGLQIAFRDFHVRRGIWNSEWVGIKYFIQYLNEPYFWVLVKNTFVLGILQVIFGFPAPIIFAILLNEISSKRAQTLIQNISYLPRFISVVIIASMVTTFLSRDGIINQLIGMMGGHPYLYMQDPKYFRPIFILAGIWQNTGWGAIIYIAALTNVDTEMYAAAVVDGAGRWKQTLHVTLPGIAPTVAIMFIMAMGNVLSVSFEMTLLLQNSLTYSVSDVISTYVYRTGLSGSQYSYATAIDMFSTVINFVFLIFTNWICSRVGETSLW